MADTIITRQVREHARHLELLTEYGERQPGARRETFRELVDLVTTHASAEEDVLFPFARKTLGAEGEALTSEIEAQHQRVNELLDPMDGQCLEPGDARFETCVAELVPLLRADLRNEEDRLLPALAANLDEGELERLGTAWLVAKKVSPNRAHPRIPRRPPGNVLAGIPLFFVDRVRHLLSKRKGSSQ